MTKEVGKFKIEDGALYGPAQYMEEQGDARLAEILAGNNTVFNMTAGLSPDVETAVLVNLQTDYAGWLGVNQMMNFVQRKGGTSK